MRLNRHTEATARRRAGRKALLGAAAALIAISASSCKGPKEIAYFQDFDNLKIEDVAQKRAITVRPEDKLQIMVTGKDMELASMFNLAAMPQRSQRSVNGQTSREGSGNFGYSTQDGFLYYTVDQQGDIDMPMLGKLHVEGMTRNELAAFIKGEIEGRQLLKDPIVTVEFMNLGISVIGEVNSPGRFTMNRDHVTVLDAVAMAGDLTIQGQRENVLVIRDVNGKRETYRLDLTKGQDLLQSPAYYLQQDDVVYVEPNSYRKRQTTVNGNNVLSASFWVSVASLLTSIAVLIFR